eukprot:455516-Amphidinium_carterae.1
MLCQAISTRQNQFLFESTSSSSVFVSSLLAALDASHGWKPCGLSVTHACRQQISQAKARRLLQKAACGGENAPG